MTDTDTPLKVTCSLCGFAFTADRNMCGGCAAASDCGLLKCPNCGRETPSTDRGLAGLLRRWLGKRGTEDSFNA